MSTRKVSGACAECNDRGKLTIACSLESQEILVSMERVKYTVARIKTLVQHLKGCSVVMYFLVSAHFKNDHVCMYNEML